jgi:hypothetical protein
MKGYHMFWLSVENLVSQKLRKTTKLIHHLGGNGWKGICWVVTPGPSTWRSRVSHLWTATQEQRDLRRSMSWSFQCNHKTIWALSWSSKLQELKPGRQWVVFGNASVWSEEMLLKSLVLVFTWPFEAKWVSWQNGLTKSCGKGAQPLQSV